MMAPERVYPHDNDSPPLSDEHKPQKPKATVPPRYSTTSSNGGGSHTRHLSQDSLMSNSGPPSGTYIIQVPKEQIFRVPPAENAYKFQRYTNQAKHRRRSCCCRCLCITTGILLLLATLLAITSGILYLIYRPKPPRFSIEKASVSGVKLSSTAGSPAQIRPVFNFTVKSTNPNGKIGIYYLKSGSSVEVFHQNDRLGGGEMPEFYAPSEDTRLISLLMKGGEIVPSRSARTAMLKEEQSGRVPVRVVADVPVRFKIGNVKTWKMTAKVKCTVVLSALKSKAKVVEKDCEFSVRPW